MLKCFYHFCNRIMPNSAKASNSGRFYNINDETLKSLFTMYHSVLICPFLGIDVLMPYLITFLFIKLSVTPTPKTIQNIGATLITESLKIPANKYPITPKEVMPPNI
ncbi:hypothetical protein SAMN05421842_1282 [Clostridium uliginosum]|uniref:Uncharacterized protein n=1 Tax=Clostridium uliginosum TaxID=119641 RepID=A0A1I1QVY8_9CLOT|nr:hypothetical protein SAMN05421842_1282 [Clostridium uliginosum]